MSDGLIRDQFGEQTHLTMTILSSHSIKSVWTKDGRDSYIGKKPRITVGMIGGKIFHDLVDTEVEEYEPKRGDLVKIARGTDADGDNHPEIVENLSGTDDSGEVDQNQKEPESDVGTTGEAGEPPAEESTDENSSDPAQEPSAPEGEGESTEPEAPAEPKPEVPADAQNPQAGHEAQTQG